MSYKQKFITKASELHNSYYNYSKVDYINSSTKVAVTCPLHGDFSVTPDNHIHRKSGCPKCALEKSSVRYADTTELFITKAIKVHNNLYSYSKVIYKNNRTKVEIICNKHNTSFMQTPGNHLNGAGCPKCRNETLSVTKTKPLSNYVTDANKIHNSKYDYSHMTPTEYKLGKITIVCPTHGSFKQSKRDHIAGAGCPKCNSSKGETAVRQFLTENNIRFEEQKTYPNLYYKSKQSKLRYDFYLPENNVLIEYDGQNHYQPTHGISEEEFNENLIKDGLKDKYAFDNGIVLIRIPYFKFDEISNIIQSLPKKS